MQKKKNGYSLAVKKLNVSVIFLISTNFRCLRAVQNLYQFQMLACRAKSINNFSNHCRIIWKSLWIKFHLKTTMDVTCQIHIFYLEVHTWNFYNFFAIVIGFRSAGQFYVVKQHFSTLPGRLQKSCHALTLLALNQEGLEVSKKMQYFSLA